MCSSDLLENGTFDTEKSYAVEFTFSGTEEKVSLKVNGNGKSEMAFEFMIPKTAKVDEKSGKIEITLASLIEGDKIDDGDPDKTNITSIAVSFAPTTVKVGDAMPTITIGDVVPAEAKADIEYKWVKADGTAAGATAEAGSYKIQLSVKADSNYQIVEVLQQPEGPVQSPACAAKMALEELGSFFAGLGVIHDAEVHVQYFVVYQLTDIVIAGFALHGLALFQEDRKSVV